MINVLIAFFSKTGRTQKMAKHVADCIRSSGYTAEVKKISEIKNEKELNGYDAYVFGCPTYFKDIVDDMKTFLFMAQKANLAGKMGGAFGSYTHIGSAPEIIHDTLAHVFKLDMKEIGPFNVKEQIIDSGKGEQPCQDYGKAIGEKLTA